MKHGRFLRKFFTWCLAASLLLGTFAGCGGRGKQGAETPDGSGSSANGDVWVPEYVSLSGEGVSYDNLRVDGDTLYYVEVSRDAETGAVRQAIATVGLSDNSRGQALAPDDWGTDAESGALRKCETFFRTAEGGFVTLEGVYPDGSDAPTETGKNTGPAEYYFCRYDAAGQRQDAGELTDNMAAEGDAGALWKAAVDGEGRFYFVMYDGTVHLADAEGNYRGAIAAGGADNWIPDICAGKDGKVYIAKRESAGGGEGYAVKELDFEKKEVGAACRNYPGSFAMVGMAPGAEQELLLYDGTALYGYDVKEQEATKLLEWADGNINGINVICVHVMEDGRILAIQREPGGGDMEMAFLTPKKAAEVVEKETITLACYQRDYSLEKTVAKFNKQSDRYRVECKIYYDNMISAQAQQDAYLRFSTDILSDHSPDLLVLQTYSFNVDQLAKNGLFEDLNPWLDASEKHNREDLFSGVLEACTYGGKLVAIPKGFSIHSIVGRTANLGTGSGWTVEDMIALAEAHPDASLFETNKYTFLNMLINGGLDRFVDWESGECRFESEEFIRLLEFTDRVPQDLTTVWPVYDAAPFCRLCDGSVLLYEWGTDDFYGVQKAQMAFGGDEINFIGFPNGQGDSGIRLTAGRKIAMLASSGNKEGAWAFLEYYLDSEDESGDSNLYTDKKRFQAAMEDAMGGSFYSSSGKFTDEYGNLKTTEKWINWEFVYHPPTKEECDTLMNLIESAVPMKDYNWHISGIIQEEAEPYFYGQKSAQAVAKVIQSRVQLYVNENQ